MVGKNSYKINKERNYKHTELKD